MTNLSNIFDTHSHYDDPKFGGEENAEKLVKSLLDSGVSGIVHACTDLESAEFGLKFSEKFPNFYTSAGIHPEYAADHGEGDVERLRGLAKKSKKVVAIGEIGLDYHYEGYDRERQIALFRAQIELANELGLPVIVHSRDAAGDCMKILNELKPKGIMHCFSGSWETAKEVLALGMYLGFTGALTFKNSKRAQEIVQKMPLDRLLLETDCPYMAPEPHRGEVCHSGMIEFTARKAAELKSLAPADLLCATEENARRVYGIQAAGAAL